ncbi:MAG: hypothetical protein ACI8TP_000754 [Acidimicrobiales bacterium]|jgi:hypothetical protein
MTRAIAAGLRGDVATSWRLHPLAALVSLQLVVVAVVLITGWRHDLARRAVVPVIVLNAVALVAVWAIRWRLGLLDAVLADG